MFSMPLTYWASLAPSFMFVLLAIAVIARALWMPGDLRRGSSCGGCGHQVVDIAGGRCAECGGLLIRLGVMTPPAAIRLRSSLSLAIFAWTALCFGMALMGWSWLQMYAAVSQNRSYGAKFDYAPEESDFERRQRSIDSDQSLVPLDTSALDFRVELTINAEMEGPKVIGGDGTILVRNNGSADWAMLSFFMNKPGFKVVDQDDKVLVMGEQFGETEVVTLYKAAGVDCDDPLVKVSIPEVAALPARAKADPQGFQNSGLSGTKKQGQLVSRGSRTGFTGGGLAGSGQIIPFWKRTSSYVGVGVPASIYAAGIVFICWRRARALRAATS